MNSRFETCYVSCACNSTPHVVDWSSGRLICYGASNIIVVYQLQDDGEGGCIIHTLSGHKGRVNCVRWVRNSYSECSENKEIVSGSSDNTAIIWNANNKGNFFQSSVLSGHDNAITVVDALYRKYDGNLELIVLTGSVDSTVRIWSRVNEGEISCNQVLNIPSNGLCLSLAITTLSERENNVLIACGYDDSKITLYSESNENFFAKQGTLSGHEDWIRALDFTLNDDGELLLASASQDATVRLWRFTSSSTLNSGDDDILKQERQLIQVGDKHVATVLDGVLAGHEGWIYGLHWHPPIFLDNGERKQPMMLLTSSLDKTLAIWAPEEQSGVWLEVARMGEIGGNGLGFYGARYGPDGSTLLVHGFNGGIHLWRRKGDLWEPGVSITGHFNSVVDLAWEAVYGRYLLSVSLDQTTRLHAPWLHKKEKTWHEMARPQVHGYDMSCIAALPNFSFVSGAEEKVVRAFTATQNFFENFERLCCTKAEELLEPGLVKNALGAAVPALGLSNRAVFHVQSQQQAEDDKLSREQYSEVYFVPQDLKAPPTEDNLCQNTLWPEVMKLYGHGYEVYALTATHDGRIVASTCKATSAEHAAVILWDTLKWQKIQTLTSHQLTVTQLAFSPDDSFLLTVSRDRCWSLFKKTEHSDKLPEYHLVTKTDKKSAIHSRIIWTCSWAHTGLYFGTGSRDGKVVIWETSTQKPVTVLDLPGSSVTALAFAPAFVMQPNEYLVSIGLESGKIILYSCSPHVENAWRLCFEIDGNYSHAMTVKRLAFRPVRGRAGEATKTQESNVIQLASCSLDHTVKVYNIIIENDVR